jgi:carbon-monoxide dehydrogenase large subunit
MTHGDTQTVRKGMGTFGSRATAVGGIAVYQAAEEVRNKARQLAAQLLEAAAGDIEFADGEFRVKGAPRRTITIQQVARQAAIANLANEITGDSTFEPSNFTFPFGTHICVVEVDPQTGAIAIKKYVAVDDFGKVINPMLVDGQVHGAIAQGIGQALFEGVIYDGNGQLVNDTLMNYAIPRAADLPQLQLARTETPSPVNPLGLKGVGEAGTIGATPAVVSAVVDALAPFGITHIDMPLTAPKIWRLCRGIQAHD